MAGGDDTLRNEGRDGFGAPYREGRIKSLLLDLSVPRAGERVLDVGCGNGNHLSLFLRKGCDVTGIDSSPFLIDLARQRLGHRAELQRGQAEELPFSDNEFDIVTLIGALEFTADPARVIAEAIRVCRGRVLIGALNRFSLIGLQGRLPHLFSPPLGNPHRYFHLPALAPLIRQHLPGVRLQWGSVLFLPWGCYGSAPLLEEWLPVMYNPFGAFFALSFPVTFSLLTLQEAIREPLSLNTEERRPLPGVVSGVRQP
jgi:SAM-dependent methyltransferase